MKILKKLIQKFRVAPKVLDVRGNEKRRYHRMKMEIPMSFRIPPDEKIHSTTTLDISGTGVSFVTDDQLQEKQELLIYLLLPEEGKTEIHAKVIRSEKEGERNRVAVRLTDTIKFDEKKFVDFYAARLKEVFGKKKF